MLITYGQRVEYTLGAQGKNLPTKQQLKDFFSCIYQNSSITELNIHEIQIVDEFGKGLIEGLGGHPSITRLHMSHIRLGSIGFTALWHALQHPMSKLEHLYLMNCLLDNNGMQGLSFAILGSTLKKLSLSGSKEITPIGCRALSTVLQHRNCQLTNISVYCTSLDDEGVNVLGSAIGGTSLKVLNLSHNRSISSSGWQAFLNQLVQTTIESLDIGYSNIDSSALMLLANIGTLKSLDLSCLEPSPAALDWQAFFNSMQTRGIQLKKLDISGNKVGNLGSTALVGLLRNMSTLKTLNMGYMSSEFDVSRSQWEASDIITTQGWVSFFTSLQDSNLDLENM